MTLKPRHSHLNLLKNRYDPKKNQNDSSTGLLELQHCFCTRICRHHIHHPLSPTHPMHPILSKGLLQKHLPIFLDSFFITVYTKQTRFSQSSTTEVVFCRFATFLFEHVFERLNTFGLLQRKKILIQLKFYITDFLHFCYFEWVVGRFLILVLY